MASVNTNLGAMQALQQLNTTNKSMLETQNRISTGLKVANAKDAAATWAIATTMRSDVASFKAIGENLALSQSTVTTARGAAEGVTKLITEVKGLLTGAQNGAVDKKKLQADIDERLNQIKGIVSAAQFNGVNMVNGGGSNKILASIDRSSGSVTPSYINVDNQDLNIAAGGGLADLEGLSALSVGDKLLANATDGERVMHYSLAAAATGGAKVSFNYKDEKGVNRTLSVDTVAAETTTQVADKFRTDDMKKQLAAAGFKEVGTGGDLKFVAISRDKNVSMTSVTSGDATATVDEENAVNAMTFNDQQPLALGETLTLNYEVASAARQVKIRVADVATDGASLGTEDGVAVIGIKASTVTDVNVLGSQIATSIRDALLAHDTAFQNAAAATTTISAQVSGSTLTLTGYDDDATTRIGDMKFSETNYDVLLGK